MLPRDLVFAEDRLLEGLLVAVVSSQFSKFFVFTLKMRFVQIQIEIMILNDFLFSPYSEFHFFEIHKQKKKKRPFFELFELLLQIIETQQKISFSNLDSLLELVGQLRFTPKLNNRINLHTIIPNSIASTYPNSLSVQIGGGFSEFGDVPTDILFSTVKTKTLFQILASIFAERRIIFSSDNLRRLSYVILCKTTTIDFANFNDYCCSHLQENKKIALFSLIYPFSWQYIFIPVLPGSCLTYCCAPMPFIIGVHTSHLDQIAQMPLEEVVFVDLDDCTIAGANPDDLEVLPTVACDELKKSLKSNERKNKKIKESRRFKAKKKKKYRGSQEYPCTSKNHFPTILGENIWQYVCFAKIE